MHKPIKKQKNNTFKNVLRPIGKEETISLSKKFRNSQFLAVSGPRNLTISKISGPRIRLIYGTQKSPKWCGFWDQKLPGNGFFWSHILPQWFSLASGAINCQNGAVSGAINCQNG